MVDDKIARICWNAQGWRKPSGAQGKSKNKKAYEFRFGFGHEEWLLDTTKLIKGWHYAYLQPIGLYRDKYAGQKFNISLYSINDETKDRWWVGPILGVEVISPEESANVHAAYKKNGWLNEMELQLGAVGADVKNFRNTAPEIFAVVKYRPESLEILDTPMKFSADDPAVKANRYILLNKKQEPILLGGTGQFSFSPGHSQKKACAKSHYETQTADLDLVHNRMQTRIFRQLVKKYGDKNVGTEQETGNGSKVDVVVRDSDKKFIFFEIKTSYSVRLSIREAVGQLLEYAFFPEAANPKKLIVASPNKITTEAKTYLEGIRASFELPVFYQRYDPRREALEDTEY